MGRIHAKKLFDSPLATETEPLKGFYDFFLNYGFNSHRDDVLYNQCSSFCLGVDGEFVSSDPSTDEIVLYRIYYDHTRQKEIDEEETFTYSDILEAALRDEFQLFKFLLFKKINKIKNRKKVEVFLTLRVGEIDEIHNRWKKNSYPNRYLIIHVALLQLILHIKGRYSVFFKDIGIVNKTLQNIKEYINKNNLKIKPKKPKIKGFGLNEDILITSLKNLYNFEIQGKRFIDEATDIDFFISVFTADDLSKFQGKGIIKLGCQITNAASIFYALKQSCILPKLSFASIEKSKIFKTNKGKFLSATNISNHKFPELIDDLINELKQIMDQP